MTVLRYLLAVTKERKESKVERETNVGPIPPEVTTKS